MAAFVAKYGEQILMAPPPEGFNLAGYLVPGVAVPLAGQLIGLRAAPPRPRLAAPGSRGRPSRRRREPRPTRRPRALRRALADVQD